MSSFRSPLTKTRLIAAVSQTTALTRAQAHQAVHAVFDTILQEIADGGAVSITNFGTFRAVARPERTGVDPRTRERITIAARTEIRFRATGNAPRAISSGLTGATIRKGGRGGEDRP